MFRLRVMFSQLIDNNLKAIFFLQRIMASNSLIWGYTSWLFNRTPRCFLKITLLLMALLFCGNVRAETITIIPNKTTTGSNSSSYVTTEKQFTYTDVSYKINNWNPDKLQIRGNKGTAANLQTGENFYFRNTSPVPGNITKIEIVGKSGTLVANKIYLQTGTNEISNQSKGESTVGTDDSNNVIWNVNDAHAYFAIGMENGGTSGNVYINSIVITYATADIPHINCSTEDLNFETIQKNSSKELQFTISATDLIDNVELTVNGEYFNCSIDYLLRGDDAKKEPDVKSGISDDDLKFALFGTTEIDDETYDDVKAYAKFKKEQRKR